MLHRIDKLIGMSIGASDGEIGKVNDVYFDDHQWAVRYLVIETGGWLGDRKVLISPFAIESVDTGLGIINVNLSRERIKGSPPIDTDKPVSRQHEMEMFGYYGYPGYWGGPLLWGLSSFPITPTMVLPSVNDALPGHSAAPADPNLRSADEVAGYHVQAKDDLIGHLEDFLVDVESWAIRYIAVDTRNWLPGKHVLIPPRWIKRLDWAQKTVDIDITRRTLEHAPEYDPGLEFSPMHEAALDQHYQRPGHPL